MNAVGIIAEYNPFHNGHAYQIQKAKELSHADYVIVAMSGNYVQRGAPAILDKFSRASMALQNGADFVFELPTLFATSSAEYFAAAGIALFNAIGCVDTISFGCETPNLPLMGSIAKILSNEPKTYAMRLSSYLKQGLSFPAAREKALTDYIMQKEDQNFGTGLADLLGSPNNILAIEYMKALLRQNSSIRPLPVLRQGSGYHSSELGKSYCSATAVRNLLCHASAVPDTLSHYVPKETAAHLLSPGTHFLTERDFSDMLYYKLLCEKENGFADYADGSIELSNRIIHALPKFTGCQSFCEILKSKEVTYTRISRLLLHILLNIKKSDYETAKDCNYIPYLRLLGFRKESAGFFAEMKKHASLPIITKPAKCASYLAGTALSMFYQDVFASDLYYGTLAQKSKTIQKNEYQRSVIVFP